MGIDILIVGADNYKIDQIACLFKGRVHLFKRNYNMILVRASNEFNGTSTYSNLSEDDLAALEFLPDFDTRYTYLLSLSLGINA